MCGYGCHIENTPLGFVYLPKIVSFIREWSPRYIILCGGYTQQKSAPGISEASLLFMWLMKIFQGTHAFFLDDDSYTTHENIMNAALHVKRFKFVDGIKIVIFCEAQRAPNVLMLARHYLGEFVESIDDITIETASWERADPFKQAFNLIYNRLAFRFPYLIVRERNKRIKRAAHI